jgi:hypothetical protein
MEAALLMQCEVTDIWPRRRANCFLWARPCELHEVCADCAGTSASMADEFPGFEKKL